MLLASIANRASRMRLPPDLPAVRDRNMLASTLTTLGQTVYSGSLRSGRHSHLSVWRSPRPNVHLRRPKTASTPALGSVNRAGRGMPICWQRAPRRTESWVSVTRSK